MLARHPASSGNPTTAAEKSPSQQPFLLSKKRLALAFAIAGLSDLLGILGLIWPPLFWLVDFLTAMLLFAVLGWHWLLLPGLVMETIPGVEVFPFWLLVVAAIAVLGTARPKPK